VEALRPLAQGEAWPQSGVLRSLWLTTLRCSDAARKLLAFERPVISHPDPPHFSALRFGICQALPLLG
jgi:hypothetical protein